MRPKNADSSDTWDRILAAARSVLGEAEESEISLRDVARTAGVSLGTVHYYFASKEALLEACLDQYYERLGALALEVAKDLSEATRENGREVIERGLRRIYRFAVSERHQLRLRARTNGMRGRLHPDRHVHVRGPYLDTFSGLLAPLVGRPTNEVRLTFQSMTYVVMQYVLLWDEEVTQFAGVGGDAGRDVIEDHIAQLCLRALTLNGGV